MLFTFLDSCVSSLRRGHANLLRIVPILTDDPRQSVRGYAKSSTPQLLPCPKSVRGYPGAMT